MPWERARNILLQILDGLEAIHKAGILHRDLKPGNIVLIKREGEEDFVKILDLGIAKPMDPQPAQPILTQEGNVIGTPTYMSPEQAQGQALDHRTDIYSLGIIIYEMLTGKVPFEDDTPNKVLIKQARDVPLRPALKNPAAAVSKEAEAVILRALKKDPTERFQSAREMAEAIRQIRVEPAPVLVVEPFIPEDTARIKIPLAWKGAGVASALLAMGFGWLGGFWMGRRENPVPEKPEEEQPALVERTQMPAPVVAPVEQTRRVPPVTAKPVVPEERKGAGSSVSVAKREGEKRGRRGGREKQVSRVQERPRSLPKPAVEPRPKTTEQTKKEEPVKFKDEPPKPQPKEDIKRPDIFR